MKNSFKNFRPVELLYLLSRIDEVEMTQESLLITSIGYLYAKGFVKKNGEEFEVVKGTDRSTLRPYESLILKALDKEDSEDLIEAVEDYDFCEYFSDLGVFEKNTSPRKFMWMKIGTKNVYGTTSDFYQIIADLIRLKEDVLQKRTDGIDKETGLKLLAFPELIKDESLKEFVADIVDDLEAINMLPVIVSVVTTTMIINSNN